MIYVFDTSSFIVLGHYYPSTFPTFWDALEKAIDEGIIVSTREVLNELKKKSDQIADWAKQHKKIFKTPADEELDFVRRILSIDHFKMVINNQAILNARSRPLRYCRCARVQRNGCYSREAQSKRC